MYPPFVTQKVEPKCAATDAAEREQRVLAHFAEPRGGKLC